MDLSLVWDWASETENHWDISFVIFDEFLFVSFSKYVWILTTTLPLHVPEGFAGSLSLRCRSLCLVRVGTKEPCQLTWMWCQFWTWVIIGCFRVSALKIGPGGAHYYYCFNISLIIESYLEYQYAPVYSLFSAKLITVRVHTAFKSVVKKSVHVNIIKYFLLTRINSVF